MAVNVRAASMRWKFLYQVQPGGIYRLRCLYCNAEAQVHPTQPVDVLKCGSDFQCEQKQRRDLSRLARKANPNRVRVGRNDPCPCKSGKKAKHCCPVNSWQRKASEEQPPMEEEKIGGRLA